MSQHGDIATGPGWELRCGDWQTVLADVETVDAVITDPPYSERTHKGQRSLRLADQSKPKKGGLAAIHYPSMSESECVGTILARWWIVFSDHAGWVSHEAAFQARGVYTFQPVVWVKPDATPRLAGDGPCSAAEYILVARPRRRVARHASRPGFYRFNTANTQEGISFVGRKPTPLMRAIVRDYSRPGDLVCDPYAGTGTTLLAAVMEGRRAIGAEMDPVTFDLAVKRLRKGYTPDLFTEAPTAPAAEQLALGGGDE